MGYAPKKQRTAWEDRFRTPTLNDLRNGLNRQLGSLLDAARERLLGFPGMNEELCWQGLPWRWTLAYRFGNGDDHAWAYLVPDPEKPKISMPLPSGTVESLPMHRLKKHVKDGVLQSRLVDGVYWATWEITSKTQLHEILEFARMRHRLTMQPT